ncbi:hypothetical protein MXB_877, partial [Myxobolus squamalis]
VTRHFNATPSFTYISSQEQKELDKLYCLPMEFEDNSSPCYSNNNENGEWEGVGQYILPCSSPTSDEKKTNHMTNIPITIESASDSNDLSFSHIYPSFEFPSPSMIKDITFKPGHAGKKLPKRNYIQNKNSRAHNLPKKMDKILAEIKDLKQNLPRVIRKELENYSYNNFYQKI